MKAIKSFVPPYMALLLLLFMGTVIFFSVPIDADFGWYEAGRHAMDGFFYLDLIKDAGFFHPVQYAMDYYQQYPAIAPVMYPPVFSLAQSIGFTLIGPFPFVSRLVVAIFLVWAAFGLIRLTENVLGKTGSIFAGMIFVSLPSVIYWSRDVMLETPAVAFIIWSFVYFDRYLKNDSTKNIILFWIFAILAPYTKQNTIFIFPAICMTALLTKQAHKLFDKRFIACTVIAFLMGLPLIYVTLTWGSINMDQSFGNLKETMSVLNMFVYYFKTLPVTTGTAILVLAGTGTLLLLKKIRTHRCMQINQGSIIIILWFVFCYLQMVAIKIKEPRHSFFWLPIIAVLAAYGLAKILHLKNNQWRTVAGFLIVLAVFGINVYKTEMNWSEGFQAPAIYLKEKWEGDAVLTNIFRDAPFIFHLRSLDNDRNFRVYRSSKIFERSMIYKEWGIDPLIHNHGQLISALKKYRIRYLLLQEPIPQITKVETLLRNAVTGKDFNLAQEFPITYPYNRKFSLKLYKYNGEINPIGLIPPIHLPIIGKVINEN